MTDKTRVWGTVCDGEFEIIDLEDSDVEEALNILDSFFLNESVCIGTEINLPQSFQARAELRELCRIVSEEKVSLVARHVPTKKLAAVAFNKLQFIDDTVEVPFFIQFRDEKCKSPNARALMDYMIEMDKEIDPFQLYNITCLLEFMFLGTATDFRKRGLGTALGKYTIELAKELNRGIGVNRLPKHLQDKRPKAVTALFTSNFSKKVGRANNFKVLNCVPHSRFTFKGKSFSDRIGPMHPDSEQVAFLL